MAEAAGLVLAALPLLVEGLRFYLKGIESIKKYWQYAKALKRLIRKFQVEQRKFGNTCTELLVGLVDDIELGYLLEQPGGVKWQEKSLQLSLRARLGASYQVFFDAVTDMTEATEEFEEKLELDQDHKPRWLEYSTSKREWKRVLFSLSEDGNDSLIQRLEKGNKDLGELLGHGLRMESLRLPKKSSSNANHYTRVQECAKSLYNIFKQSFTTWSCGCSVPHKANLRLETRQENVKDVDSGSSISFNVLFSFDSESTGATLLPWNWRETRIEPMDQDENADLPTDNFSLKAKGGRKTVSFAPAYTKTTKSSEESIIQLKRIDCLCQAMAGQIPRDETCLGILVDELQRQHRLSVRDPTTWENGTQAISLKSLLGEATKLEKRQRLALGVKLASSLLQLHQTPWLPQSWGKRHIMFPRHKGTGSHSALIQTPMITKHFSAPDCITPMRQLSDPIAPGSSEVRNQSTFDLGVLLIELWYHQPLEALRIPEDLDKDGEANQITDFVTARRLTEEIYREAGDWYGHAVRRCIYCEFDQRHNDLGLSSMKEAVHQGVLLPLQENLKSFCGGESDDLLA